MASDRLDLTSSAFDPEVVLMSSDIILPCPNAKVYSNLAEFETYILRGRRPLRQTTKKNPDEDQSLLNTVGNKCISESPFPTSSKQQKTDVLIRMKTAFNKGPLNLLNKCVQQRIRVKVSIRNYGDIRGTCTGFIVAFDKHWNLAMRDVDETYVKRRTLKTPVLKTLPRECYRTVATSETSEATVPQASISACCHDDSETDDSARDTEDIPCTPNTLALESCPTKQIEEIPEAIINSGELSIIDTCDLLQKSVKRLNLEELECPNKSDENIASSEAVDVKSEENVSVVPVMEAVEKDTDSQIVLAHRRRKKKQPEICQRHVNQLFVRGDNVVFIRLLP